MDRLSNLVGHFAVLSRGECTGKDGVRSMETFRFDTIPGPPLKESKRQVGEAILSGNTFRLFEEWRREYGECFKFQSANLDGTLYTQVVSCDTRSLSKIMKENHPKPPMVQAVPHIGLGILGCNEEEWQRQRKLLGPMFKRERLRKSFPFLEKATNGAILSFFQKQARERQSFDPFSCLSVATFQMVFMFAMEHTISEEDISSLKEAFDDIVANSVFADNSDGIQKVNELAATIIKNHKNNPPVEVDPNAFLDIVTKQSNGCPHFSPKLQLQTFTNIIFAGYETTAATTTWVLLELARNTVIQTRLQSDIDALLVATPLEELSLADIYKLPYLTKIINEVLRLWPVVPAEITRELRHSTTISGYMVPAGTRICFPNWLVQRDTNVWGSDANEFQPDREWHAEAFQPFNRPPRDCMGRNLALMEVRYFCIAILSRFTLELANEDWEPTVPIASSMKAEGCLLNVCERT
eukprot:Lithocolla_globosa_v1_NODE_801_length_3257_cov_20.937851.p1 type:complete len:467 gc:universal NODE_801_length_3257_cov_20.937851:1659-3059(+)